jgi:hypothetical protein
MLKKLFSCLRNEHGLARVTGPFLSISASGTVSKTLTASTWKGIQYIREWFKPANPRTGEQMNQRAAVALLPDLYATLSSADKLAYNERASGLGKSGVNVFKSDALKAYTAQLGVLKTPGSVTKAGTAPDFTFTWVEA